MLAINYTYAEIQTLIYALHFVEDESCNLGFIKECKDLRKKIKEVNDKRTKKAKLQWNREEVDYILSLKKKKNTARGEIGNMVSRWGRMAG